jgi:hypothetical protein
MSERAKVALLWLFCAGLSGPIGIILHELGHYVGAVTAGFPDAKLSYASVSYRNAELFWQTLASGDRAAAAAIYPLRDAGIMAAAGPAVTALLILASVWILTVSRTTNAMAAFCAGLALMAGVRSLTGVYYILQVRPNYPGARPFFDEINAARAFDIPVDWIVWPSAALVALAWIMVVPRLTPDRWTKLAAAVAGPILGILIYAQVGPFILP